MDNFFKITERGSTVKTEIVAGITTFFAMAYIVLVQPAQMAAGGANGWLAAEVPDFAADLGVVWNAVYIGGILAAVIGTVIMALYAKMPYALACGMGLNSFFCTSFMVNGVFATGNVILSYQTGLIVIFLSGIIFLLLSITGAREYIAKSLPDCLKKSIPAGIGLFICLIGCENAGIVTNNPYTCVQFADFHGQGWAATCPALAALLGFVIIGILAKKNVKGAIIFGILGSTILYYVFTGTAPSINMGQIGQSFRDFGSIGFCGLFDGDAWGTLSADWLGGIFGMICLVIAYCLVDMFDTVGTLYGCAAEADLLDENNDPINVNKCMTADSIATVAGALLGTSTTTTYVESSAGIAAGGKTGLTGIVVSACFVLCLLFSPLAAIIPTAACAPALMYVGVLMVKNFSTVDMKDPLSAIPAFVTMVFMPLTYSISNGIGLGCITYLLMALFTGNLRKNDWVIGIIAIFFVFRFIFVTM